MEALKKIFTTREKDPVEEVVVKEEKKDVKLTFFESGYGSSKQASGNHKVFRACLNDVYMDYKRKCAEDEELQKKLKQPHIQEKGREGIELKKRQTAKAILEESIKTDEEKIEECEHQIVEVRENPEKYVEEVDKKPKAQFYLGLIVLIPITFYLLVFYISASFSAFFKDFENSELSAAIFDGKSFSKALEHGVLEAVFIATIPFAFMGLGYLIHMFQKHKNWLSYVKIGALFIITFIFDAILAYQIEMKIYDYNKTPDSPEFDLSIAFSKVEFWGIIFAGFVVYIIWGLVFDFIMKEYENIDKIKAFIRSKRETIVNLQKSIAEAIEKLNGVKEEISGIEARIANLQRTIDGFVFPNKRYLTYHAEYVKGWYLAITDNFLDLKRRDELLSKCDEVEKEHLSKYDLTDENTEGIIYKSQLK
ncbi:ABC transporter permease [Tenacibaculum discolor]|uniref:ABC transporter permease n=1 Tax=Tenacibaculum discolor TaxID=361581 RepID=A0A2G1BQA1_9FLAO|nr:ABC transporter permease [Tenacibaculum discolor]MDP2541755.1 ABC transporter permease [Tenacibaculum discolor]PHN96233.1 ABC transporter permease [Tenacibaculum discolor]PHN99647.1 ABC transporter permease [Rhodobacteraceae bacterium 4F10]